MHAHRRRPELYSKYLGETEGLIRRLFERARQVAPSVIFFDEIDALAPTRSGDTGNAPHIATIRAHAGRVLMRAVCACTTEGMGGMGQRVLSQLLNEMDGVSARSGVLLLACTSRPDLLDPALLRPGRFERLVYVGPPTSSARAHLLEVRSFEVRCSTLTATADGWIGAADGATARNAVRRGRHSRCVCSDH
jgi:SpoVK/Ycf46/Vps4 family AAA+-type ATPase